MFQAATMQDEVGCVTTASKAAFKAISGFSDAIIEGLQFAGIHATAKCDDDESEVQLKIPGCASIYVRFSTWPDGNPRFEVGVLRIGLDGKPVPSRGLYEFRKRQGGITALVLLPESDGSGGVEGEPVDIAIIG